MNYVRCIKTVFLFVVLASFIGCKSKQDKPGASSGTPQEKISATAVPPQGKAAAPVASPQDMADARAVAAHVLSQFEAGNFLAIYEESAPDFKKIGTENQFVTKFQQTRQRVGVLKNSKETSFVTRPDNIHVLIFRLSNEHFTTDMRLSLQRAKSGKMELLGLNQHDEPKK